MSGKKRSARRYAPTDKVAPQLTQLAGRGGKAMYEQAAYVTRGIEKRLRSGHQWSGCLKE
jgi:hypothetical protein